MDPINEDENLEINENKTGNQTLSHQSNFEKEKK